MVSQASPGYTARVGQILRTRRLGVLLGGVLLSGIGSLVHLSVTSWLMYSLTKSAAMVGLLVVVQYVPMLALTFPAGVLADHKDKRKLLLTIQTFQMTMALTLAIIVWTGNVSPLVLLVVTAAMGAGGAIGAPLLLSTLTAMVDEEHMLLGASMNSVTFHLASSLGPLAAAGLLKISGPGTAFFVNALSFIPSMLAVRGLPKGMIASQDYSSFKESIRQTFRFAAISGKARRLVPAGSAAALVCFGLPSILPAYSTRYLNGGSGMYGLLMAAFGAGALTGAVLIGVLSSRVGKRHLILLGASLIGAGVGSLSFVREPAMALAAAAAGGAGQIVLLVTIRTVVQLDAPRSLHGRVISLWLVLTLGIGSLGATLLGRVADQFGVLTAARMAGTYALLLAIAIFVGYKTPAVDAEPADHSLLDRRAA